MLVAARWDDLESTGRHSAGQWSKALGILGVVLVATACHPPEQRAANNATPEPPAAASSPSLPAVRLIAAGNEPLRPFRFHVPVRTRMRFEMDASLGPVQFEAYVPERTGAHGSVVLVKPLDPAAATRQGLGGTGEGTLDDRGFIEYSFLSSTTGAAEMGFPDGDDEMLRLALQELVPVFPEQPIGVGARWELRKPTSRHFAEAWLLVSYELTGVDGDRCTLELDARLEPRSVPFSVLNSVFSFELFWLDGRGHGDLEVDLGLPVAFGARELMWSMRIRATHPYSSRHKYEVHDSQGGGRVFVAAGSDRAGTAGDGGSAP